MNYEEIDAVNWSTLKNILRSPKHYKAYMDYPLPQSAAQKFGVAVHEAILEPDKFQENYVKSPAIDRRTKEYKEWAARVPENKQILSAEEFNKIASMQANFIDMTNDFTPLEWQGAKVEQILTANIDEVFCKGRADILTEDFVWDIKTCQDASESSFKRDFYRFNYAAQLAFYADMAGKSYAGIIAIEKDAPYGVNVLTVKPETLLQGRLSYKTALSIYNECLKNDNWPGYTGGEL